MQVAALILAIQSGDPYIVGAILGTCVLLAADRRYPRGKGFVVAGCLILSIAVTIVIASSWKEVAWVQHALSGEPRIVAGKGYDFQGETALLADFQLYKAIQEQDQLYFELRWGVSPSSPGRDAAIARVMMVIWIPMLWIVILTMVWFYECFGRHRKRVHREKAATQ